MLRNLQYQWKFPGDSYAYITFKLNQLLQCSKRAQMILIECSKKVLLFRVGQLFNTFETGNRRIALSVYIHAHMQHE